MSDEQEVPDWEEVFSNHFRNLEGATPSAPDWYYIVDYALRELIGRQIEIEHERKKLASASPDVVG